ncbi:C39 family peptidase [Mesobacillus foraminis]|uniref:C39 family peptidase n=1 Tax=Mesobacillus foraminis TaxID=279826 RepID=UPI000EF48E94|nr:C39 family peptidase [Mesobacillus foraminis]
MNQLVKLGVTALFISGVPLASSEAISTEEVVTPEKSVLESTQTSDTDAEFLDVYKTAAVNGYNSASSQPTEALLDVPLLNQMDSPRLYNGCEVTSLAMMLLYKGFEVTKNELADAVARVPLTYSNGDKGNPNSGFVGNMEDGPGLGVYHGPIFELAWKYAGDKAADLTGQPFTTLLEQVAEGNPVWVITTSTFAPVSSLETWQTHDGAVGITYSMHSVVITGYDSDHIYINNPYGMKNQAVDRENFIKAWEQMGEQAVVIN